MKMIMDNYTRIILTVIAALLLIVGAGLWCENPKELTARAVAAGIPDSGEQLNEILVKLDAISAELQLIQKTQLSGQMKVQVVEPTKDKEKDNAKLKVVSPPRKGK